MCLSNSLSAIDARLLESRIPRKSLELLNRIYNSSLYRYNNNNNSNNNNNIDNDNDNNKMATSGADASISALAEDASISTDIEANTSLRHRRKRRNNARIQDGSNMNSSTRTEQEIGSPPSTSLSGEIQNGTQRSINTKKKDEMD